MIELAIKLEVNRDHVVVNFKMNYHKVGKKMWLTRRGQLCYSAPEKKLRLRHWS